MNTEACGKNMVVGIDLGGTNMQLGVVDGNANIISRAHFKTNAREGRDEVLNKLAKGIEHICAEAGLQLSDLDAVGIAAPGAIDMPSGIVLEAPNLHWSNVPLRDLLQDRINRPVIVDNDVNAAVWGEFQLSREKKYRDCLGVWCGTGVGGGLVFNGKLHHGSLFTAGEFGQMVLYPDQPAGKRTIEDYCSRTGISRLVRELYKDFPDSLLRPDPNETQPITTNTQLAEAWQAGDALATKLVENAAYILGVHIANAVTLLALEVVIIGGGVAEALGPSFVQRIRQSFDACVFPEANKKCDLLLTHLAADAGLLGAALLAQTGDCFK